MSLAEVEISPLPLPGVFRASCSAQLLCCENKLFVELGEGPNRDVKWAWAAWGSPCGKQEPADRGRQKNRSPGTRQTRSRHRGLGGGWWGAAHFTRNLAGREAPTDI